MPEPEVGKVLPNKNEDAEKAMIGFVAGIAKDYVNDMHNESLKKDTIDIGLGELGLTMGTPEAAEAEKILADVYEKIFDKMKKALENIKPGTASERRPFGGGRGDRPPRRMLPPGFDVE